MNESRALLKRRLLGLAATALGFYLLFWVVLARVDVTGLIPTDKMASAVIVFWRDLPFFDVQKAPAPDGNGQATYYTVPTKLVTKKELAQMMGTNTTSQVTPPQNAASPSK